MAALPIDRLVLIVISQSQSKTLMSHLNKELFYFTIIDSGSSLFHEPTICLLLGLNQNRMETLNRLVQKYCQPYRELIPLNLRSPHELSNLPVLETQEGGALLYGLSVEHFEQI